MNVRTCYRLLQEACENVYIHVTGIDWSDSSTWVPIATTVVAIAIFHFWCTRTPTVIPEQKIQLPKPVPSEESWTLEQLSPPEKAMYRVLDRMKIFEHFEETTFSQLKRHIEILKIGKNEYLFHIGDPEEYIFVIQEGRVKLYITEEGSDIVLSEFTHGDSIYSFLSILDVLTGYPAPHKTVFARALEDSTVIRLPVEALNISFENRKHSLVRVIMTRMQRVTFQALFKYLGLSQLLSSAKNLDGSNKASIENIPQSEGSKTSVSSENSVEHGENSGAGENIPQAVDAAALRKSPTKPESVASNSKPLRFGEFDTVVDDDGNVFHRESTLPTSERVHQKLAKQPASVQEDIIEQIDTREEQHKSGVAAAYIAPGNENATNRIDKGRIKFRKHDAISKLSDPEILDLAIQEMLQLFGIEDHELLLEKVKLERVPQGETLIEEGCHDNKSLYLIVSGALRVSILDMERAGKNQDIALFEMLPGDLAGQHAVLTGEPPFFTVRCVEDSIFAKLTKKDFDSMAQQYPRMVLSTAHTVVQRAGKFVREMDFALNCVMVEAGEELCKQDALSDGMYIVLNGKLGSEHKIFRGKKYIVAEYGRGEAVGMTETLLGTKHAASVHAVRDTELAKIPQGLLKHIRRHYPDSVLQMMLLMSEKNVGSMLSNRALFPSHPGELLFHKRQMKAAHVGTWSQLHDMSTIAVLPVSRSVPLDQFAMELKHALTAVCDDVLHLTSDIIKERLGKNAFEPSQKHKLTGWLAKQERFDRIVLFQTDEDMSDWTKRCIRQSDAILFIALGDGESQIGRIEQEMENQSVRALKVLVLLHQPEVSQPTKTADWLNIRSWLTTHLHIKAPKRLFTLTLKSKLKEYQELLNESGVDRFNDFSRLARYITGKSIALVLGGGGARGIAHLGVIQSLLEVGIPIDQVGGTSIGAFMGALWAGYRNLWMMRSQTEALSSAMSSRLMQLFDLTYPITSMFSGSYFNNCLEKIFKDVQIEDMWLPYFTITTDITDSKMRVHTDGSLWRYVRGSMSLSFYFPPICDPKDGHLLMDGGYINNLPANVARFRGANKVIAVDVGADTETDFANYGDYLSGWWLLWKKWTGMWTGHIKVPNVNEIQYRLSYVPCQNLMELVKNSDYCIYLRPEVANFGTVEFNKWQKILDEGYKYGTEVCSKEWAESILKELPTTAADKKPLYRVELRRQKSIEQSKSNAAFTDL